MYGEDLKDDFEEYNPLNNFKNNKAYISMDEQLIFILMFSISPPA